MSNLKKLSHVIYRCIILFGHQSNDIEFLKILSRSKGYCVDTIGLDEDKIKKYVKYQEGQERIEEQQSLSFGPL